MANVGVFRNEQPICSAVTLCGKVRKICDIRPRRFFLVGMSEQIARGIGPSDGYDERKGLHHVAQRSIHCIGRCVVSREATKTNELGFA
jgi:hypothetical protein